MGQEHCLLLGALFFWCADSSVFCPVLCCPVQHPLCCVLASGLLLACLSNVLNMFVQQNQLKSLYSITGLPSVRYFICPCPPPFLCFIDSSILFYPPLFTMPCPTAATPRAAIGLGEIG